MKKSGVGIPVQIRTFHLVNHSADHGKREENCRRNAFPGIKKKSNCRCAKSKTLGDIEELLPVDIFQRIHHSTVVNLGFITHYVRTDGGYVKLQTGEQFPVSKSKKENLKERLGLK